MSNKYLFQPKDINGMLEESARLDSDVAVGDIHKHGTWYGKASRFVQQLDHLFVQEKHNHVDFMTAGNFSLHNIIEFLLEAYGPCLEMYISTWAIKEAAARTLVSLKERGLIGKMYGIFDYRIKTIDARSFHLIESHFGQYELTKNHSKIITMRGKDYTFTIMTTANLSNNPRIETGFISRSHITHYFHTNWMKQVISGKKVH